MFVFTMHSLLCRGSCSRA